MPAWWPWSGRYWETRYSSLRKDYQELMDSVCELQKAEMQSKAYGVSKYVTAYNKLMDLKVKLQNKRVRGKEGW